MTTHPPGASVVLGYGWLGAVLSVFVAIALLVRWRVAAFDDDRRPLSR